MIYDIVTFNKNIPLCFINIILYFLLKTIKSKTGVDLSEIKPIELVTQIEVPCFFIVAHDDTISRPDKVKDLFLKLKSKDKEFYMT